jgi:hypothetical protein
MDVLETQIGHEWRKILAREDLMTTDFITTPIPRRRAEQAHARATDTQLTDVVQLLVGTLGKPLLAVIVGRDAKTIGRWAAGANIPTPEERVLRNTLQIVELLTTVDSESVARAWFMGMNPQLDDDSPAEAIAEGRARDVLAAARAYINAG